MADNREDPYAFIIHHCRYSPSQEDLLQRSKFAREDDTLIGAVAEKPPPPAKHPGDKRREFIGGVDSPGRSGGGKENDFAEAVNLGFRGERKESPKLKIGRRLGGHGGSPLVHCSGRFVIEREGDENEEVVFEGDVEVKIVNPLRCVAPNGVECNVKHFGSGSGGKGTVENRVEKKLEFEGGEEVIEEVEDEGHVLKNEEIVDTEVIEEVEDEDVVKNEEIVDTEVNEDVEDEGNVLKNEEIVDTEVNEEVEDEENVVKNEEIVDTEVIEVGEEGDNDAIIEDEAYVETEAFEVDGEGGNRVEVDVGTSKGEGIEMVDTQVFEADEAEGFEGKVEEIANLDTEVFEIEEEGVNCTKVDGERSKEEMGNVGSKGIEVGEGEENRAKVRDFGNGDTVMLDDEEEEGNRGKFSGEASKNVEIVDLETQVTESEREGGNCAKVDGETSKTEEGETEVSVVEEEERNCVVTGGETSIGKDDGESRKPEEETRTSENEVKRTGKRKLPRSMLEQWGQGLENGEGCSKEARVEVEGNGLEKSENNSESSALRCILVVLKLLASEKSNAANGGGEVDLLEIAKTRGMTFPRPRFRAGVEEDA